jgi:uncharacterized membrane protein YfcA
VPAWTLLSIASSLAILGHDRRQIAWRDVLPFLPWCMLGIVIGLYFFTTLDARTLAQALGAVVFLYAARSLWTSFRPAGGLRMLSGWWCRSTASPPALRARCSGPWRRSSS